MKRLGLTLFTPPAYQLPMLHVINIPAGVEDVKVRRALLDRGIEIAGGFGPLQGKTWRVGLMGHNAHEQAVDTLLAALDEVLREQGVK
ncbi:MAG: hypothetical protein HYT81_10095 [Gemmatimonadetes bacterium]|nr:hypothetical protein [Gemmatimonadota bacterium]